MRHKKNKCLRNLLLEKNVEDIVNGQEIQHIDTSRVKHNDTVEECGSAKDCQICRVISLKKKNNGLEQLIMQNKILRRCGRAPSRYIYRSNIIIV